MASTHKSLRSGTANKRPTTSIADGQIALNTNATSPGLYFKDSTGASIIKIGPVHVGTTAPNVSPAGSSGNSTGEAWLDTSLTPNGWKVWTGAAWLNATPAGSTTVQGLLELATDAETQAGSDAVRAVTPAGLQSKLSDSTSTTSSTTIASSTAVKVAYDLADAALPKSGGTVTGNLEIGTTGSLTFEGATADGFETIIAVVDPTADRTITLPNVTGTVVTTGDTGTVTSTMLAGSIPDSKLSTISTAGKVDAAAVTGTIPGTVLGNSTAYVGTTAVALNRASANQALTGISSVALPGATSGTITVSPAAIAGTAAITLPATTGTLITSGDTGSVTNTMLAGSIADSKLDTISTASKVSNSATTATNLNTASAIVARDASGNFTAGTITAALTGTASAATVLATARTITIGNTGKNFDGSAAVTWTLTEVGAAGTAVNNTFTVAQRASISALTDGATITPDFSLANNFSVTLAGNRTLANPTNQVAGQSGSIFITQDATGSRTLAYGTNWDFAGGTAPTLSTAANAIDRIDYIVRTSGSIHAVLTKAFS